MAGRIPEEFINEVRSNVNIVDVVSQYVSLDKKGKDYVGLCPFHQEKTPSFSVSESKQFFKCFGCGKGGNVFKFMMLSENLSFPEAVEKVAAFANIQMPTSYRSDSIRPLNPLQKMHEEAMEFYHHVLLATKAGEAGLAYANERNLSEELLDHFQIGYAPSADNLLLTYLQSKNYSEEQLLSSGLFVQSKTGQLFDRFRDRLMFPLANESGQVVGFSGRRLSNDPEVAKYMNSPETPIFSKSKVLFHFKEAKKAVKDEHHLVLYEGYMDVIAAYKAGVKTGVASMGTSLTSEQVYLLRRVTPNIIVNYDGDDAGVHAAERAAGLFKQHGGFNLGIVVLPEKLDPDEYVTKYGKQKYLHELQAAMSETDFYLLRAKSKYNLSNDRDKVSYINDAVQLIAALSNPVERDIYVEKLALETGVSTDSLRANLLRAQRQRRVVQTRSNPDVALNQPAVTVVKQENTDKILLRLLYLFINSPQARDYLLQIHFLFPDSNYAQLANLWINFYQTHDPATQSGFYDFVPANLQDILDTMIMARDMPTDFSKQEIDDTIAALNKRNINEQIEQLKLQLADAKRREDLPAIVKITQEVVELKRKQQRQ